MMILEHLYNFMIHLINNATTHGIEKFKKRHKLGKFPEIRITPKAFLQGYKTVIIFSYDGEKSIQNAV